MAEPPFPAPAGMRWSPTRRRFFKLDAAQAEVEQAPPEAPAAKRRKQEPPIPPSAFAQPGSSSAFIHSARSSLPRSSTVRSAASLPRVLRQQTVRLVPMNLEEPIGLLELGTSNAHPNLVFLALSSTACGYHAADLSTLPLSAPVGSLECLVNNEPTPRRRLCFCWQDECQSWHTDDQLIFSRLGANDQGEMKRFFLQAMDCPQPEDGIVGVVHAVPLTGHVVIARWSHSMLELHRWGHSARIIKRRKSDFLSAAVSRDGRFVFAGRRNGQLGRWTCSDVLPPVAAGTLVELPGRCVLTHATAPSDDQGILLREYRGAITCIKAVGADLIVATSNGELERIDSDGKLLQKYHGHVSTWSLDLPVAISARHRLVAALGQDDVLRTWSLDHPLPVASLALTPSDADHGGPARMTFCEGSQMKIALARGGQLIFVE